MKKDPSPRSFEMEIDLQATPEVVWQALTDPAQLVRWFPVQARVRPGEGGEVVWSWGEVHEWPQTIEVWEPGRRLRTRYESGVEGKAGKVPLFCDFEIEGRGGSTRLRFVHSGFGPESDFDGEFDGISRGWPVELRSLRHYLELHRGQERQLAWAVRDTDLSLDEAWKRLTGPEGLDCGAAIAELDEGQSFRIPLPADLGGDVLTGRALKCQTREFSGVAESHGDAFVRISAENCGDKNGAWLWLALYGAGAAERDRYQVGFEALLQRIFAGTGVEA